MFLLFLGVCFFVRYSLVAHIDPISDEGIASNKGKMLLYPNRIYKDEYKHVKLLIPATKANDKFCHTLFSSLVNGYPAPNLINYNLNVSDFYAGQSVKIGGYTDFIDANVNDKDVVILVDGYDVTFQLSLDILMNRYGKQNYETIFAADKLCFPTVANSHYCDRIPQSTLPANLYGAFDQFPYINPRFLNSGTAVGLGKSMRKVFQHAAEVGKNGTVGDNDQAIIAETFSTGKFNFTLDYESNFFQTLINSWVDMDWVVNPDPNTPPYWYIPLDESNSRKLDVHELALHTKSSKRKSPWMNRRLARNNRSNTIPVLLHHNMHKELVEIWFTYAWFGRSTLSKLLQTMLIEQKGSESGAGAWNGNQWIDYSELCGSYDLFKDQKN